MSSSFYLPWLLLTLSRLSGWLALACLGLALCVTPVARLGVRHDRRWAVHGPVLRRLIGMTSAWLALLHASLGAFALYDGSHSLESWLFDAAYPRAGLGALAVLLVLLVTSFPVAVRSVRLRAWKELHRLAYVAFALAVQHALLSPFAPRTWVLALASCVVAVGLLRWLPEAQPSPRSAKPPDEPLAPPG